MITVTLQEEWNLGDVVVPLPEKLRGIVTWECGGKVSGHPDILAILNCQEGEFGDRGFPAMKARESPWAWVCLVTHAFPGCKIEGYEPPPATSYNPGAIY